MSPERIWEYEVGRAYIEWYYPYTYIDAFYALNQHAGDREIGEVLKLWNNAMGWTDVDYFKMLDSYDMIIPGIDENINDSY